MSDSTQRWLLVTCSYRDYRPDMGVPVGTSVGRHPAFKDAPQVSALKPFGVFGVMADEPVDVQRTAYQSRLHRLARRVEHDLDALTAAYPGTPLVLLCWCDADTAEDGRCHRRWAADWFRDVYGLAVSEVPRHADALDPSTGRVKDQR